MSFARDLKDLQRDWDELGRTDPLWAILSREDRQGNKWDAAEFFATGRRAIEREMSHIRSLNIDVPSGTALDFGCGVGRLTQALAEYFDEVYGVDIAPAMLELAEKYNRHRDRCQYLLNTVDDLSLFSSNTFGFIYSSLVLQHMEPQYSKKYIREFLRILAPGGLLVFQLLGERKGWRALVKNMLPAALLDVYYKIKLGHPPLILIYGMMQQEVIRLLQESGAKCLDIQRESAGAGWISYRYYVTKY